LIAALVAPDHPRFPLFQAIEQGRQQLGIIRLHDQIDRLVPANLLGDFLHQSFLIHK
jgi:hypothetical protein